MFPDDDEDDDVRGFRAFTGRMPGGMSGGRTRTTRSQTTPFPTPPHASGSGPHPSPSEITKPLKVSLEDLYAGTTKHLKVGRKLLDGSVEDKVLEIQIQPGWKSGTKVRFPKAGNEVGGGEAQDLVFVVEEKPHAILTREGNDLVCSLDIPLVDALTGGPPPKKWIKALDGRNIPVPIPAGIISPGQQSKITGEGMPIRKDGSVKRKGDLIVKWNVKFPERLTASQKEGIRRVLG
jgi:DnaJ homolog subfamily B member 4